MAMNNLDPITHNLQLIYQPLEGLPFKGTYLGIFEMPQTENRRHKVECNHLSAILHNISRAVIDTYGTQVWKGITGPVDGVGYTDYWLWLWPDVGGVPLEGCSYDFMIERCTPFQCRAGSTFTYGVSIKAHIIQDLAVAPTLVCS